MPGIVLDDLSGSDRFKGFIERDALLGHLLVRMLREAEFAFPRLGADAVERRAVGLSHAPACASLHCRGGAGKCGSRELGDMCPLRVPGFAGRNGAWRPRE